MKNATLVWIEKKCRRCGKTETFRPPFDHRARSKYCKQCMVKKAKNRIKTNPKNHLKTVLAYKKRVRGLKNYKPAWIANEYKYWQKWVVNNPGRRRIIALRSYHKRRGSGNVRVHEAILKV